jgi:hypothetical protein
MDAAGGTGREDANWACGSDHRLVRRRVKTQPAPQPAPAKEDLMRQEVSRDLEASKPLATQPQLTTDVNWPVTISQNVNGITFDPPSPLTVNDGDTVTFAVTDVSGTLNVSAGFFTTSGSFSLSTSSPNQLLTVQSNLPPRSNTQVVFRSSTSNANGTITISTGTGPGEPKPH